MDGLKVFTLTNFIAKTVEKVKKHYLKYITKNKFNECFKGIGGHPPRFLQVHLILYSLV